MTSIAWCSSGRLTRDPELRHLPSGTPVLQLRIAVNGRQKDDIGTWGDKPNFFDVKLFGQPGRVSRATPRARAGGSASTAGSTGRPWEAQDGSKRSKVEVVAFDSPVPRQPRRRRRAPDTGEPSSTSRPVAGGDVNPDTSDFGPKTGADDDIPF